ncbi:MAG: signal peptidase II [Gemmatimonadaceae bacterium]
MSPKARTFWPLLFVLVLADCTSKDLAVQMLSPGLVSHEFLDSLVRFTLVYNPDTAFGFDLQPIFGNWERAVLIAMMLTILVVMMRIYWKSAPRARLAAAALALTCGGAIGNIFDRIRYPQGVVDFIDLGFGTHRLFICNVADVGVSIGAVLLALVLLRDEPNNTIPQSPA